MNSKGVRRKKSSLSEVKVAVIGAPGVGKSGKSQISVSICENIALRLMLWSKLKVRFHRASANIYSCVLGMFFKIIIYVYTKFLALFSIVVSFVLRQSAVFLSY